MSVPKNGERGEDGRDECSASESGRSKVLPRQRMNIQKNSESESGVETNAPQASVAGAKFYPGSGKEGCRCEARQRAANERTIRT